MTQLAFDLSPREVGEQAAAACNAKAQRVSDFDSEGAGKFIFGALLFHGPTSGEVLTDQAKAHGYRPHDDRAFGSVYLRLVRRGQIRCVGFVERKKGRGAPGARIWEAIVTKGESLAG